MIYNTLAKIAGKKPNKRGNAYLIIALIGIGVIVGATMLGYDFFGILDGNDKKEGHVVTKQVKGVVYDWADYTTTTACTVTFYKPGTTEQVDTCTSDGTTGIWTSNIRFTSDDKYDVFVTKSSGYYGSFYPRFEIPRVSDPTDDYIVCGPYQAFYVVDQTAESDLTLTSFTSGGTAIVTESAGTDWDVDGSAHHTMFVSMTIATDGNGLGSAPGVSTWDPTEAPAPAYDDVVLFICFNSSSSYPDDHTKVVCETPGWFKVSTSDYTYFCYKVPAFIYSTDRNEVDTLMIEVTFDFTSNTGDASSIYIGLEDMVGYSDFCANPGADSDAVVQDNTAYAKIG